MSGELFPFVRDALVLFCGKRLELLLNFQQLFLESLLFGFEFCLSRGLSLGDEFFDAGFQLRILTAGPASDEEADFGVAFPCFELSGVACRGAFPESLNGLGLGNKLADGGE
ncbi:MAG: hypothetical protein RL215_605, partial [Planctomycetota bacterium]